MLIGYANWDPKKMNMHASLWHLKISNVNGIVDS